MFRYYPRPPAAGILVSDVETLCETGLGTTSLQLPRYSCKTEQHEKKNVCIVHGDLNLRADLSLQSLKRLLSFDSLCRQSVAVLNQVIERRRFGERKPYVMKGMQRL